jgi:hypothetical protein
MSRIARVATGRTPEKHLMVCVTFSSPLWFASPLVLLTFSSPRVPLVWLATYSAVWVVAVANAIDLYNFLPKTPPDC